MSESYLYKAARDAIDALFSDRSVPQGKTYEDLNSLRMEIEELLDTLDADDWGEEGESDE